MSNGMLVYIITRLDALIGFLWLVAILPPISMSVMFGIHFLDKSLDVYQYEETAAKSRESFFKRHMRLWKSLAALSIVSAILLVVIPSSRDMAIIIGIDKLSNSTEVNTILQQLYQTILHLLQKG